MRIVHFCAGLEECNGMANTARQFVAEERAKGYDSRLTNNAGAITGDVDQVVIHGAWLPVLWKVAKRAKHAGARLVIRPAGSYDPVRLAYHGWKKRLVSNFEHRMLRRADALLATCAAEKAWIASYVGNSHPPIELTDLKRFFKLVSGGVGSGGVESGRVKSGGVGEFGSGGVAKNSQLITHNSQLHLLYLGRRHPLKGVEYLEKAVAELSSNPVNPVNPVQNSSTRSARLKTELKIVSNAFGEELEKVWEWCDVLVLPTLSENFGRVVAEALERGKHVITTDGAPAWEDGLELGVGSGGVEEWRVGSGGVES